MTVAKYMRVDLKRINLAIDPHKKLIPDTDEIKDLLDIQINLLNEVIQYGRSKVTEDKEYVWECDRPIQAELYKPYTKFEKKSVGINGQALDMYSKQLLNPDKGGFEYTYGERIVPNIDEVMKLLIHHKNTRRAVINISENSDRKCGFMPCMQQILLTIDYNGYLQMDITFRSHDILSAWYANVYALLHLQDELCNRYNFHPGILRIISFRPHFYPKRDAEALKTLGANPKQFYTE